jgi:hypothetical protein
MTSGVTAGVNLSYDEAFDTRVSDDIEVRFGGSSTTAQRKQVQQLPVINALISTPSNRTIRVYDHAPFSDCAEGIGKYSGTVCTPESGSGDLFPLPPHPQGPPNN